eukprot:TRINITY_DN47207_c0_g1_i1.p1 TRINITY_DN47207_c0_g1~~TRINITY_DN47207_c0_g1_i1.p1  ORF type:complete len:238 (-),score=73.11 TRINITY_DN47207_c0_g1_i1:45-758(-)
MSIKFREDVKGELQILKEGSQIFRGKRQQGVLVREQPKMAFSTDPVRKLAGRGCWFELRVDDLAGGELNVMAIGFTATDPQTLAGTEEEEAEPLPGCAGDIQKSYVCGYTRSVYWDGERVQIDAIFKKLKPTRVFKIGALANMNGGLDIFINRRLVHSFDPSASALEKIDLEQPLWAVVDCCGGLKKASLESDSVPPTPEEAAAPEADDDEAKEADAAEGEEGAEEEGAEEEAAEES